MEDGLCVPCSWNTYGYQCIRMCNCELDQRCDNALGCVNASLITLPASTVSTTVITENETETQSTLLKTVAESEISNPTPTNNKNYGILDREIVIYSVVVACILVILGLSYLVLKNRQNTKLKLNITTTTHNTHSNRSHSLINSNLSIYDEIDENMIIENLNMVHINRSSIDDEPQTNADNTNYLHPIHLEDKSSNTSVSVKSVNNSYLSFNESDQTIHSDQSQRAQGDDDTTSYLHPYHTIDEDWEEKTHQYDITHISKNDTDDSSDSSTQMINDGYLQPYQPLKEGWKQLSHSYEAPVTVHQCQQSLMVPFLSNKESKEIENIDKDERQTMEEHNNYPSRSFYKDKTELSEKCQTISIENISDKTKLKHDDYFVGLMNSSKHEIAGAIDYNDAISISLNTKI
ncbi:unnamed protein product [Mytilus edulis]|uniref:Uncharacterized protein n=1 Tax=Mytilus edulis TaxID=6550 RepID=A0A8S3U2U5_MYTED|nr:unnamed protein product [Mytilus edulis]